MKIRKMFCLSDMDEFFTLNHLYKWIIYLFGWLVIISSGIFLAFILILYFFRDKSAKKKENHYLQFGYQRLPYFVGWACFVIVVALAVTAGAYKLGDFLAWKLL
ncbi:MAG: hypothetical protein R6U26_02180 [Candidatus Undinarchaeales archaeon]